jgi:cleavage stimulation factor subunit 3
MDALRKVYHRAVQIPLDNVEKLWQELEAFETNLNKITAKKFMSDLSPSHMQARTVVRQLANHLTPLFPPSTPSSSSQREIFLPSLPTFNPSERTLVGKWKAYLKWEESNPLEIEDKDKATLVTRVQGVYRKAVIRMRYYTEIWWVLFFSFLDPLLILIAGSWHTHGQAALGNKTRRWRSLKLGWRPIQRGAS